MFIRIIRYFWPEMHVHEVKKFSLLSAILFCIIGTFWLLRLLKMNVMYNIAFPPSLGWPVDYGPKLVPYAKRWSPLVIVSCALFYSKLVDWVRRHQLFYVIGTLYIAIFSCVTALLAVRCWYGDAALGRTTLSAVGWLVYFASESFGSLMVPLFWSFTVSITTTARARIGFPLIIVGAEIGSISCSSLNVFAHRLGGIWPLFGVATVLIGLIMVLVGVFVRVIPSEHMIGGKRVESEAAHHPREGFFVGMFSGLLLIATRPYLFGVFLVSTLYEVMNTLADYQMQRQAHTCPAFSGELGFAKFQALFGVCSNTLALLLALLGTGYLIKRFGVKRCLLLYPLVSALSIGILFISYTIGSMAGIGLLAVMFAVMMVIKAFGYAVNNPLKDMMYIPTTRAAKFKAKGWTDMFGRRGMETVAMMIAFPLRDSMSDLIVCGSLVSFFIIALWIIVAWYVGVQNQKLVRSGHIIE